MAGKDTVTAMEEMQRYYRKAKSAAQPLIDKLQTNEDSTQVIEEDYETAEMFNENVEGEKDWVDVVGSGETPSDNNQENYRIATGTGPIEVAGDVLLHKMSELGTAAAAKASQAPAAVKVCAENQTVRLAEAVGRVTASDAVAGVLQRHPLLERCRVAFLQGRERGSQASLPASQPPETQPSSLEEDLMAQLPRSFIEDGEMEDVPLREGEGGEEEEEREDWEDVQ